MWLISGDERLPASYCDNIREPKNEIYLSVVSTWEVIIKSQLGKLSFPEPPEIYLPKQRKRHMISSLDVDEACVTRLAGLPAIHRDPFDRLLICQALEHGLSFMTRDKVIKAYPVALFALPADRQSATADEPPDSELS